MMTYPEFLDEWRNADEEIVAHTSGSTGAPKEIRLKKSFVAQSAWRTIHFFALNGKSRLHSCVAPDFIGGKMMGVRAELIGGNLTWELPSNRPLRYVRPDATIDLLAVVPSQMVDIVERVASLPEIKAVIVGGSAINPTLRRKIAESGLNAYETYGMTETASHIALRKIEAEPGPFCALPGIWVGTDSRGCLAINFDSGERFVTNDLATTYGQDKFMIDGRIDHVIITGGKKVNPLEVEMAIAPYVDTPFVVTSVADEKWGRKIVLKIEGIKDERRELRLVEGIETIAEKWKRPKEIVWLDELPRTKNGKIMR